MYYITEQQINLIGRRLNAGSPLNKNGKEMPDLEILYTYAQEDGLKVSAEQSQKGFDWLMNLYKTPAGKERKNNPYGYREQEALDSGLKQFTYDGHIDAGNYGNSWYAPIYTFIGNNGASFQYYVAGGEIKIIG